MSEQQVMQLEPESNNTHAAGSDFDKLTPTQFKVLLGVHSGHANKQIAFDLGISEATVKAHMTALMRKLNARNRTQVAILAEKMARTSRLIGQQEFAHSLN